MHYYKKNIGDYAKKAGRLTMLQHGAYTLLLDACYDREVFPTLEDAIEWTWASTKEETEAVEFVLKKFFTLEDGRYVQSRIQEELEKYHSNSETNKRIALEREAKRKQNSTKRAQVVDEATPNHKPITKNQEPVTKGKSATKVARPPEVEQQVWDDWMTLRRAKKAPVTATVFVSAANEAAKANITLNDYLKIWCARGSQGMKAEWITDSEKTAVAGASKFAGDI